MIALVDALVVDQVAQRLAHLRVGQPLVLHRHREVVEARAGNRLDLHRLVLVERREVGGEQRVADVDVALLQPQPLRLRFGQVAHQHPRHRRRLAPIGVVPGQDDVLVRAPLGQDVRARACGVVGQPALPHVAVGLVRQHLVLVEDRAWARHREQHHDELRVVRLCQVKHEGVVVLRHEVLVDVLGGEPAARQERGLREVELEQSARGSRRRPRRSADCPRRRSHRRASGT